MLKPTLAVLAAATALTGCADAMLSNERLADRTSPFLPDRVLSITDRRSDGPTNVVYTAVTSRGAYSCSISGGGLLAGGITNDPHCNKRESTMSDRINPDHVKAPARRPATQAQRDAARTQTQAAPSSAALESTQRQQASIRASGLSQ